VSTIAVGKGPEGLAVNARCLYVANRGSNTVSAIRLDEPPVA
jgi:DNA-binding beta-propeller fold protein YncE